MSKAKDGVLVSQAKIIREEIKEGEATFSAVYVEMKNACLIFVSEGEDRLGTLAVSVPQREGFIGPPLSSILFGDRNVTVARLLAERLAHLAKKLTLVSVYIKTIDEMAAGPIILRLAERVMKKGEAKQ
ncbi:MAG: proteasome assembly chaperone 4 family protein [Candidatus Bathyarchaeia archaeon]